MIEIQEKIVNDIDNEIINENIFRSFLIEKYENNEIIMKEGSYQNIQLFSIKNSVNNNSIINFADIEYELKELYNLNNETRLMVFLAEIRKEGYNFPIIEYKIYDLDTRKKLNLSLASKTTINIGYHFEIEKGEEHKYNPFDKYYSDPCLQAISKDGFNMIINDRIDEFLNNNYSLCEKNCKYKGYNSETGIIECECSLKDKFRNLSEILNDDNLLYSELKKYNQNTNFYVISCYKLLFNKNAILKNIGNYIVIFLFIAFLITYFIFIIKGYDKMNNILKKMVNAKFYYLSNKDNNRPINDQIKRVGYSDIYFSKDNLTKFGQSSLFKKLEPEIKKILEKTNQEINWLSYDIAKDIDNRKFFQYYFYLIQRNNLVLYSFTNLLDYNLRLIKIYLFILSIEIFIVINTIFFNDTTLHKIYINKGNINFKENYLKIFYSFIISNIIILGMKYLISIESYIIQIKEVTKKAKVYKAYITIIKKTFKRYLIFAVINILFILFSWIYLSCFFFVYKNSQIYLIINTIICFIFSLVYPFGYCFIPTIIRFIALGDKNNDKNWLYKISQYLQF